MKCTKCEVLERALLIEAADPTDRSQEAAHYNWLDDRNEQLTRMLRDAYDLIEPPVRPSIDRRITWLNAYNYLVSKE